MAQTWDIRRPYVFRNVNGYFSVENAHAKGVAWAGRDRAEAVRICALLNDAREAGRIGHFPSCATVQRLMEG